MRCRPRARRALARGRGLPGAPQLVEGVGAALAKGDAVIVVGHVYTSEYEDRDGNRRVNWASPARSEGSAAAPTRRVTPSSACPKV